MHLDDPRGFLTMKTERDPYVVKAADMLAVEYEADNWTATADNYHFGIHDERPPVTVLSRVLREADEKKPEWPKVRNADGVERTLPEWLEKFLPYPPASGYHRDAKAYLDTLQPPEPDPLLKIASQIVDIVQSNDINSGDKLLQVLRDIKEGR